MNTLREKAEAAREAREQARTDGIKAIEYDRAMWAFRDAVKEDTIIAILDVVDAAKGVQRWWEEHGLGTTELDGADPCPMCGKLRMFGCTDECPGRILDAALAKIRGEV